MRTPETIRRQLKHLHESCDGEPIIRQTWIAAIEWVLDEDISDLTAGLSPFAELATAAMAACHALRSYQYGNGSPELAAEIADNLDSAIRQSLERRDLDLRDYSDRLDELKIRLEEITRFIECVERDRDV